MSIGRDSYEPFADRYAAAIDTKPHNAFYERPATLSLLPSVDGLRVLDAGCGPGVYSEWLSSHGASVTALDITSAMLTAARARLGHRPVSLLEADLESELPFREAAFDLVLSALVLCYVRDWERAFAEFHRVLRPDGVMVFSMWHPADVWEHFPGGNYFAVELTEMPWKGFGPPYPVVRSWRRSWSEVLNPLIDAGFRLERILEPAPTPEFRDADPHDFEKLSRTPGFLCIRVRRAA